MKIPHLKYIQSLIVGNLKPEDISEKLSDLSLPLPVSHLETLYREVYEKDPEYFSTDSKKQFIDRDVLDSLEITPMVKYLFHYGAGISIDGIEDSFKLVENTNVRNMLYVMVLAGMYLDDISMTLNEKFDNLNVTTDAIVAFKHYFFNLKDYTYQEKVNLEKDFAAEGSLKRLFRVALKGDKGYTLWKLNAAPNRPMDSMLREMFNDSFYMFKEKAKNDSDVATRFGTLALKLSEKLDKLNEAQNKSDDMFSDIMFDDSDEDETPTIKQFAPVTSEELDLDTTPVFKDQFVTEIPNVQEFKPPLNTEDLE